MRTWVKALIALAAVWLAAGAVIYFARAAKPTPDSVGRFIQGQDMGSKSAADRDKAIRKAADLLNRLTMDERQELRRRGITDRFVRGLTPDEQGEFLDLTLPTGFKQMMEAFNKMDSAKRKRIVDRAVQQMQQRDADGRPPRNMDDKNTQRIVNQGLRSFYSDASAETKMDLAPLIDEMQHSLQGGGGR